ncbi:MAG: hypothetical protein IPG71_12935 [bacterium]|nr:hypothetical protein [bacterium]
MWRGIVFANYYSPDFIALRSQSVSSYGEAARNENTIGVRAGVSPGRHVFAVEVRDTQTPNETPTVSPSRATSEAELSWWVDVADAATLSFRFIGGSREEAQSGSVIDRDFERARVIASLVRGMEWTARFDHLASRDRSGANPTIGSYAHLQVAGTEGRLRPGARIAFYSIPSSDGPHGVYETTVAGAYPLRSVTGDGRVLATWLTATTGALYARVVVSFMEDQSGSSSIRDFGLELGLRQ